jgi:transposase
MDPFPVVCLAGAAPDRCRRPIQQITHGHPGLLALSAADEHVQVESTRTIYQQMIAAYREPGHTRGRALTVKLTESPSHGVPAALSELITPGRTLKQRADDVLAHSGPARYEQRADRGDQRTTRAPPRPGTRIPQPHQLHRQITARVRRLQTPTTPSIVKSRLNSRRRGTGRAQL